MKKKILSTIFSLSILTVLALPAIVGAQTADDPYGTSNLGINLGENTDIKATVASIINILLGFLGIIAVIIILAGGFKWMTAGGNEDRVGEAKKMIIQGIIGLVIIFASWAIASFVITSLRTATNV
jgi:type IV secretory pathway VirB2 component (pilin)